MQTQVGSEIQLACARAAYEVNRIYCLTIGDASFTPWEEAPEWQRASVINGVPGALAGNTPEQSHEGWTREKLENGWTYGPVKDPEKREHPCLVPYDQLPPSQRAKDALYLATVRAVAEALGDRAGITSDVPPKIEPGSLVQLKSGSKTMVVFAIEKLRVHTEHPAHTMIEERTTENALEGASCGWWGDDGQPHVTCVPLVALKVVPR